MRLPRDVLLEGGSKIGIKCNKGVHITLELGGVA